MSSIIGIAEANLFYANLKGDSTLIDSRMAIRIYGIDIPQKNARCAREKALALQAQDFTLNFLRQAKVITLHNSQSKALNLVAHVYADNKSLAQALIKQGLAIPRQHKNKKNHWCQQRDRWF